jgi:hypothetical protein
MGIGTKVEGYKTLTLTIEAIASGVSIVKSNYAYCVIG